MGRLGVFVKCHFGRRALLPLRLLLLLLPLLRFLVRVRFMKLLKGRVCILRMRFRLWPSLCFRLGGGSGLILRTSSSFPVRLFGLWVLLVFFGCVLFSSFFFFLLTFCLWVGVLYDLMVLEGALLLNLLNCDLGLLLLLYISFHDLSIFEPRLNSLANC
jgi:hypothetical protein